MRSQFHSLFIGKPLKNNNFILVVKYLACAVVLMVGTVNTEASVPNPTGRRLNKYGRGIDTLDYHVNKSSEG